MRQRVFWCILFFFAFASIKNNKTDYAFFFGQTLGILRDDYLLYPDRLQLWNDFNLCWLAVCQKQKDLCEDLISTGHPPSHTSLISRDQLDAMGKDLIHLCDQLEPHGLVDYQLGVWEEEILSGMYTSIHQPTQYNMHPPSRYRVYVYTGFPFVYSFFLLIHIIYLLFQRYLI